jgi:hypothetical protein
MGSAIAQAVSFKTVSHHSGPISITRQVMWDLWRTKWNWGRYSPSTFVSPDNPHSTSCSILIMLGSCNRPTTGRSTKWTHSHCNPQTKEKLANKSRSNDYVQILIFIHISATARIKSTQPWRSKTQSCNQISDRQINLASVFKHHQKMCGT